MNRRARLCCHWWLSPDLPIRDLFVMNERKQLVIEQFLLRGSRIRLSEGQDGQRRARRAIGGRYVNDRRAMFGRRVAMYESYETRTRDAGTSARGVSTRAEPCVGRVRCGRLRRSRLDKRASRTRGERRIAIRPLRRIVFRATKGTAKARKFTRNSDYLRRKSCTGKCVRSSGRCR